MAPESNSEPQETAALVTLHGLLRAWSDDVSDERASEIARSLGVSRSTLSNWKSGARAPGWESLARLDAVYRAGGALLGLAGALETPAAFEPRRVWWHNFSSSGGPVWAWLRPGEQGRPAIGADVTWGPLGARLQQRCTSSGMFVTLGVSVANPPICFELDEPGFVDFGQGRVPAALGLPITNGVGLLRLVSPRDDVLTVFSARLREGFGRRANWLEALRHFLGTLGELVEEALDAPRRPDRVIDLTGHDPGDAAPLPQHWPGERYKALREARRLSQAEVASRASAIVPGSPVSDDHVSLFEGGGRPRVKHLAARLDVIYRADGQSMLEMVSLSRAATGAIVSFPDWWEGPVWIRFGETDQLADPEAVAEVTLSWPPWQKRLRLRPGTTVTTRKAKGGIGPLELRLPEGWALSAGIGVHPGAIDVNYGWHAIDGQSASAIFTHYHEVYLQLFGRTRKELIELAVEHRGSDGDRG